jgi:hypothetical protein
MRLLDDQTIYLMWYLFYSLLRQVVLMVLEGRAVQGVHPQDKEVPGDSTNTAMVVSKSKSQLHGIMRKPWHVQFPTCLWIVCANDDDFSVAQKVYVWQPCVTYWICTKTNKTFFWASMQENICFWKISKNTCNLIYISCQLWILYKYEHYSTRLHGIVTFQRCYTPGILKKKQQ